MKLVSVLNEVLKFKDIYITKDYMYKNFTITESERQDIFKQHKKYGFKNIISEDVEIKESLKYALNNPSDEKYFARHGEDSMGWTGSSNKIYFDDSEFGDDYDDETYDDFDSIHNTHPDFYKHYSGNMGPDHAKSMFDSYKEKHGPLHIKRKRQMENPLNEGKQILINTFKKFKNSKPLVSEMDDNFGKFDVKKNASEMYQHHKGRLEQAIHFLEDSAKKGEDTSHYHMVIKMALREMDSFIQDLMK